MLLLQATEALQEATQQGYLFASERIYTVLTVVLLVLAGFITLLLLTNRRISRLEKKQPPDQFTDSKSME